MKRKIRPSLAFIACNVLVLILSSVACQSEPIPTRQNVVDGQRYAGRNERGYELERHVHQLVNKHRVGIGLTSLDYNEDIAAVARQHSAAMATGRSDFSHNGANDRQRVLAQHIRLQRFAENIAMNTFPARQTGHEALVDWLASPSHRAAIEGNFTSTGIGAARDGRGGFYFTQIFLLTK